MTRSILKCMLLFALIANSSCVRDTGFSKMHNLDFNLEEDYLRAWKTKYQVTGNSTISYLRASPMRKFIRNIARNKVLQQSKKAVKPPDI
ncbi:hypothetical protein [Anseongella ginsenosidimutans]|nr:hypothetical protein [Anseongella ginsenosidimutans]QEC52020.1 hypothetical protein FRZ59_06545 [Anseongella ginsenosidimutans]